jgi:hypothetical protein
MNTYITIKPSELNQIFLAFLKKLIATSKSSELTITLKLLRCSKKKHQRKYRKDC